MPRNVPLLPYIRRGDTLANGEWLRRCALADPAFPDIVAGINAARRPNFNPAGQPFVEADFQGGAAYDAKYADQTWSPPGAYKRQNVAWPAYLRSTRMFFGHAFCGAIATGHGDHSDCPGPVFDWHRFARELSDYWWYPFDIVGVNPPTRRPYQAPRRTSPVLEYYFDESEATRLAAVVRGIHGAAASPTTFEVVSGTPIYSMANGTLVAARIPTFDAQRPSTGFALVCHEVFPHLAPAGLAPDALDYGRDPEYVYALYTHLGTSSLAVDFDGPAAHNPDWLNRVLIRIRECQLGVTFYGHPTHHGIANGWNAQPLGSVPRLSLRDSWVRDGADWGGFLNSLRAGDLAIAPLASEHPVTILQGDFLGSAGTYSVSSSGVRRDGLRVELFGNTPLLVPSPVLQVGWLDGLHLAQRYASEWARPLTVAERLAVAAHGHDPDAPRWWNDVVLALQVSRLPANAWLPRDGVVWHSRPLDLARWLNDRIWKHERQKYRSPAVIGLARPRSCYRAPLLMGSMTA